MSRGQAILDAAVALFHERGYAAVGIDDIGARAGISGPAVYRHFSGKSEILVRLVDGSLDSFYARLTTPSEDPRQELAQLARLHAAVCLETPAQLSLIVDEWKQMPDDVRRRIRRRTTRYVERWTSAVRSCYPDASADDVDLAVRAAIGMLNSVIHWSPDPQRSEELGDLLAQACLHSLDALGASTRPSGPGWTPT